MILLKLAQTLYRTLTGKNAYFFVYLRVYKEEGDLLVLKAGLQHDAFDVVPPFCLTIVLSQFDLKTLIVRPDGQAHKVF